MGPWNPLCSVTMTPSNTLCGVTIGPWNTLCGVTMGPWNTRRFHYGPIERAQCLTVAWCASSMIFSLAFRSLNCWEFQHFFDSLFPAHWFLNDVLHWLFWVTRFIGYSGNTDYFIGCPPTLVSEHLFKVWTWVSLRPRVIVSTIWRSAFWFGMEIVIANLNIWNATLKLNSEHQVIEERCVLQEA